MVTLVRDQAWGVAWSLPSLSTEKVQIASYWPLACLLTASGGEQDYGPGDGVQGLRSDESGLSYVGGQASADAPKAEHQPGLPTPPRTG